MKIEIGESLIYSWLRHEKQCQLVQTNWKASPYWNLDSYEDLRTLADKFGQYYSEKYTYDIFKGCSLEQFLKQAEIDAMGIAFSQSAQSIFAVDVAFHEGGLNYGDKETTVIKLIQKCVRIALCLYGFFNIATGEIIFASPKINHATETLLSPIFIELSDLMKQFGLEFNVLLYCNDAFYTNVMEPILTKEAKVADTTELFLRSIQLYKMFSGVQPDLNASPVLPRVKSASPAARETPSYTEMKAINKIPKWATSSEQNNYRIIRAYYQILSESGRVNRPALEARCQSVIEHPDVYVRDFRGNFASMKTDKGNSHGKVFEDDGYNLKIWAKVSDTLEAYKSLFLK